MALAARFCSRFEQPDAARLRRRRKGLGCALFAALLFGIAGRSAEDGPERPRLGKAERYLRWSEAGAPTGQDLWAYCARLYASFPPVQKLFGGGPGVLYHADQLEHVFSDAALDTAHNEYLQYLLTTGALGLSAYLAALFFAIRAGVRAGRRQPLCLGFLMATIVYASQAVVNIAQPASTPLFFVLLGVLSAGSQPKNDEIAAPSHLEQPIEHGIHRPDRPANAPVIDTENSDLRIPQTAKTPPTHAWPRASKPSKKT